MRLRYVHLLFFLVLFISCKNDNSEIVTSYKAKLSQEVNEYEKDSNKDTLYVVNVIKSVNSYNTLSLKIENKDTIIDYKYTAKEKYKNLSFRFYTQKDIIVNDDVFYFKNKQFVYNNITYKIYKLGIGNGTVSHPRMLFFNKDYGILASVAYGANFLFLKDSISKGKVNLLFDKMIRS